MMSRRQSYHSLLWTWENFDSQRVEGGTVGVRSTGLDNLQEGHEDWTQGRAQAWHTAG